MPLLLRSIFSLLLLSLIGCASTTSLSEPRSGLSADTQPGKSSILTRESAMFRSRQIHKIAYQIWFGFDAESEEFQGRTKILFDVRENAFQFVKKVRLDFTGGKITSVFINGKAWDAEKLKEYNGEWLDLSKSDLLIGQNKVEIAYSHPYSKSGNGLYRFKDSEDGKIYIQSDLEPFSANLVFPCFDQPDLKASFEVTAEAPTDWTVVANMPARDQTKVDGRISWQFPPSPQMSTYLFAMLAGPWKEWKSDHEGIPLGLFARQSVAKSVDFNEWFRITKKGLEFFTEFFGYPYPYAKYDQILLADFNSGAMENIGAVTFNDSKFIFRGVSTEEQQRGRADTILHEMAHMWFGDLVTMRWWNGLWLNESFATYMASVAIERTKLFPGAPQAFFGGMKRWAYSEDQMPTTHPIEVSVADTNQATANFDGITYGKGAAALKQLHYLVGDEDFQEGLHRYFSRFANRNTSLADFMNVMSQTADRALTPWVQSWLQTTGYNKVGVELACDEDLKISKLDITQSAEGKGNVMRPHKLLVGLYYRDFSGHLAKKDPGFPVTFDDDRETVSEAIGKKCPDLVMPNEEDFGYLAVDLDAKSLETVRTSLSRITDPFTRHLLVFTLWEMVKSGKWKVAEFGEAALGWLKTETNKTLFEDLSEILVTDRHTRLSVARILDGPAQTKFLSEVHGLAKRKAETSPPGSDLQRIAFHLALRSLAPENADWALKIYEKKLKISGLKLDSDLKWDILAAIARVQPLEPALLEKATQEDSTRDGVIRLLEVNAILENSTVHADLPALFAMEKTDPAVSNSNLKKAMKVFLNYRKPEGIQAWKGKYFSSLENVGAKADASYSSTFTQALYPAGCSKETSAETTTWLAAHPGAPKTLRIALAKVAFAEGWCAAIRAGEPYPLWQ